VTITLALVRPKQEHPAAGDAAIATVANATPADAAAAPPAIDAAQVAVVIDAAAAPAARDIAIKLNVPTATLEIDGAAVPVEKGIAHVSLAEGTHKLVATAAGRTTVERTISIGEPSAPIEIKLERKASHGTAQTQPTGAGSGSAAGSGAGSSKKDATIDPFQ
jgi:hypothetical protein